MAGIAVTSHRREPRAFARGWVRVHAPSLALAGILLLAAILRLTGQNWDGGRHMQPEERAIAQIAIQLRWPDSPRGYFDSQNSPLNPYNNNIDSFLQGDLPLFVDKLVADIAGRGSFDRISPVARTTATLYDLLTVFLVFLVARRLFDETTGLIAALLAALSVLPIQLAHFGTFDTYATAACLAAFLFALRAAERGHWWDYGLIGVSAGLAIGAKVEVLPVASFFALPLAEQIRLHGWRRFAAASGSRRLSPLLGAAIGLIALIWTFRIAQPYAFRGPSPFNFGFDPRWIEDYHRWRDANAGRIASPEFIQWARRTPLLFLLKNTVLWGLGLPLGLAAFAALGLAGIRLIIARRWPPTWQVALAGWPALLLLYHGIAFVKTTSSLAPAYPFLAILAAALLVQLWQYGQRTKEPAKQVAYAAPLVAVVALTALYAIAFTGIYARPNPRIATSQWIFEHVPDGSSLLTENWDDQLPLSLPGYGASYDTDRLELYEIDRDDKISTVVDQLDNADVLIVASNRLTDSIPRIPEKYPATIAYYRMLFSGELGFELVQTFNSKPSLFGVTLDGGGADQAFTVYDHPTVRIFRKTAAFNPDAVYRRLSAALTASDPVDIGPRETGKNRLMETDGERIVQQTGGTWSSLFHRDGLANHAPVLIWYLALQLMALAAFPLCWRVLGGLPDRGYAVAKTIGMLTCGYVAWLLPSLKLVDFGRGAVIFGLIVTTVFSAGQVVRRRAEFVASVRALKGDIVATEAVFLAAFALWVWLRSQNPDLWHPYRGGEKPMEFAYFNAIIRSTHFPPYDPWFAGGYINYYYLGYALMAAITRFTGVVPWIAFNLAVPTLFALLVLNAWSFVRNMLGLLRVDLGKRTDWALPVCSLLGPLFVVGLGNLDLARRVGRGEYGYGSADPNDTSLGRRTVWQIVKGVWRTIVHYKRVPTDTFWAPSRVIPDTVNEFPNFTFLFADFHPHMVGLTFSSAALVVALAIFQSRRWPAPTERVSLEAGGELFATRGRVRAALAAIPRGVALDRALLIVFTGLVIGALYPLNTWDFPTYVLIVCGAFALLECLPGGSTPGWQLSFASLRRAAIWSLATVVLGRIYFAPYFAHYAQPNTGFMAWDGTKTRASQFALIHGIMLFFVVSNLLAEFWALSRRRAFPLAFAQGVHVVDLPGQPGTSIVAVTLRRFRVSINPAIPISALIATIVMVALLGNHMLWFLGILLLLDLAVALARIDEPLHLFLCGMVALALVIAAAVERFTLRGDIGRFNTVFKFYEQIWLLLSLAAAVRTVVLVTRYRLALPRSGRIVWSGLAAFLLLAGLVYPALATPGRLNDRFVELPPTLNGMAYMTRAVYNDATPDNSEIRPYPLIDDYLAINWLLDNVQGSPVILEGITNLYRWGSRVSIYTGLPTVIGWDWHQSQQRAGYEALIQQRKADVARILGDAVDFAEIAPLLDKYHVRYIYVGPLERIYYSGAGLAKFDAAVRAGLLTVAYQQGAVTIYEYSGNRG